MGLKVVGLDENKDGGWSEEFLAIFSLTFVFLNLNKLS
jgi:hypothetical protein